MDDTGLKKLTTEQQATLLAKEVARVDGRIGEFLKLLVSHYPQGLTRTEIKSTTGGEHQPQFCFFVP